MEDFKIKEAAEKAAEEYMQREIDVTFEDGKNHELDKVCSFHELEVAFIYGAKWVLHNQWHVIERDKDGFAINTSLGKVLIIDDSGEIYVNDYDDDYVHNAHCKYYMPIPSLPENIE